MTWLLHNYFLPTLNPSTVPPQQAAPLRPLAPILKQYKSLRKIITRDASLRSQYQQEIKGVFRDVERWIAEATVAANVAVGELGWDTSEKGDQTAKERWALERLCDGLMDKGALAPLSKKYASSVITRAMSNIQVQKTRLSLGDFLAAKVLRRIMVASSRRYPRTAPRFPCDPLEQDRFVPPGRRPSARHGPDRGRHDVRRVLGPLGNVDDRKLGRRKLRVRPRLEKGHHHLAHHWARPQLQLEQRRCRVRAFFNFHVVHNTFECRAMALLQALCAGNPEMDEAVSILLRPQTGSLIRVCSCF